MSPYQPETFHVCSGGGRRNEKDTQSRMRGSYIYAMESCNIRTLRHRWKGFQRLRAGPKRFLPKVPSGGHFKNCGRRSLLRRLRLVERGRAAEPVLSCSTHAILTDLKYSNLSLFEAATRIYLLRFLPKFQRKREPEYAKEMSRKPGAESTI